MEFRITGAKGFHVRFGNDVVVSVQFGPANYADNYDMKFGDERKSLRLTSTTAEIAVWVEPSGKWLTPAYPSNDEGYEVLGRQTPEQMLAILNWAAKMEPATTMNQSEAVAAGPETDESG